MCISQTEGTAQPCITSALLETAMSKGKVSPEDERLFKDVTGVAFGGKLVCLRAVLQFSLTVESFTAGSDTVSPLPYVR